MKLPLAPNVFFDWPAGVVSDWAHLLTRTEKLAQKAGGGSAFDAMCDRLRRSIARADLTDINEALGKRLGARALTWLWNNEKAMQKKSCQCSVITILVDRQKPRLTRTTLLQLCKLYFQEFDQLDKLDDGLFISIEAVIRSQLRKIPETQRAFLTRDPVVALQKSSDWLIGIEGPARLSGKVRESGEELEQRFTALGLIGFDVGRYGDLCRAHYYIEALKVVPIGHWDPVFDELLKPSVSRAPFGNDRRMGHVALEIIIDRAGSEVSEAWQNFVVGIAGDPRIKSSAKNYQEWWKPLGSARLEKVRGWLSREDLKLFLQALEQYGIESGKADLKRMFPARKRFLEGLYHQKLIRNTRLMLGHAAKGIVKKLLNDEIKTSFATLEGTLADKAIIYLDCGDFHLIEGSHSFKIWVYLAQPGVIVPSYDFSSFTHSDLTQTTPAQYEAMYELPREAVTHNGPWQSKVVHFLAEHGVELDIESLLTPAEYRGHLTRFGVPVVKSAKVRVPEPKELPERLKKHPPRQWSKPIPPRYNDIWSNKRQSDAVHRFLRDKPAAVSAITANSADHLSKQHKDVLRCLAEDPNVRAHYVATLLQIPLRNLIAMFFGPLAPFVQRKDSDTWALKSEFLGEFK
jgi:hypothetical protein